ncbi:MAG: flagellar hook assembly protein FlgD [Gammaproteobacteria bacterium]|jgi:flagellar basal-body rod modification protein FlgD|nr:flagellar hook assembly protein FlgD [Gammaproteobacteria bacterium]
MDQLSLDSTLAASAQSNVNTAAAVGESAKALGQADFIELLVAQIKNQDPTKPLDPSQFMSQLAQFSTVNGIQEMKDSFDSLAGRLSSEQSLQAAGLVGRDVLVPGGLGLLTVGGSISGQVDLPQSTSQLNLRVMDEYGVEVRHLSLGGNGEGSVQFQWDGIADDGSSVLPGRYRVIAEALIDGELQAVETSVDTRVASVTLNQNGSAPLLNLESGDSMPLSNVQKIR